jgi:hypothetical protein
MTSGAIPGSANEASCGVRGPQVSQMIWQKCGSAGQWFRTQPGRRARQSGAANPEASGAQFIQYLQGTRVFLKRHGVGLRLQQA